MATAKKSTVKATPKDVTDRNHLIATIQERTGCTKAAATQTLTETLETIRVSLKKNKRVQLLGFGTFDVVKRAARMGHNPSTGEPMKIKASKTVRFRPGQALKTRV